MLEKVFSWSRKKSDDGAPAVIHFGRYSDNNKSLAKIERWNEAEALFKEKKYFESIAAFFEYLQDEDQDNVEHTPGEGGGTFLFYQGTKVVRGRYSETGLQAETRLCEMPAPSVPVMRRLLEMNFNLYYSRYAEQGGYLTMLFDSDLNTANPSKLYYGLKELATKADKQDDLLVQDFTSLLSVDTEHTEAIPEEEKSIKYRYFRKWITDTLEMIAGVDADKYSGGIAYLLLALCYRIDYLIVPEGKLLAEIEKIVEIYFRKDDRAVTEKNHEMIEAFTTLMERKEAEFYPYLFRSRFTFSIVTPQNYKTISDAIFNANGNIAWYRENKLPGVAARISEYGFSYCQYSYSLPRPVSELFHLFMMTNYPEFFAELGFTETYYDPEVNVYHQETITARIEEIVGRWKEKYPDLKFRTDKLKWDSPVAFNLSFTTEIESLSLEHS